MDITHVSENSLSAEAVQNNVDLLIIILLLLPAKSLVRFKCISKRWSSLISSSKFCSKHTLKNLNSSIAAAYLGYCPLANMKKNSPSSLRSLPKLDFMTSSFGVAAMILHSCNGLMLCSRGSEIVVCNLTTQKFKVISPPSGHSFQANDDYFLAFYRETSPHYKIVLIIYRCFYHNLVAFNYPIPTYDVQIYFSDGVIWKKVRFSKPSIFEPFVDKVLCEGAIYWVNEDNTLERFDINEEYSTTTELTFELVIPAGNVILWFGEYNGKLYLTHRAPTVPQFQILEMDMQNFSWTMKYDMNIVLPLCTFPVLNSHERVHMFCMSGGDDEGNPTLLLASSGKLITCNPKSSYMEILQDLPVGVPITSGSLIHSFIESLALI